MDFNDAPDLVQSFLNYKLAIQGRSSLTVFQYYHDLRTLFRYILKEKYRDKYAKTDLEDIDFNDVTNDDVLKLKTDDIYYFLSYTAKERDNGNSTRARKLSAIRSFYKYLTNVRHVLTESPAANIDSPKKNKKLPKFLSLEESKQLLSSVDGKYSERDYAIITLFLNCGLRLSELAGINLADMNKDKTELFVTGKGSKERMIYLNETCGLALDAYLAVRPTDVKHKDRDALFISRNRNRISIKTVQWLIYKHLKGAELENKHLSVHKLRHTAATLMYAYGNTDVRVLKDILGHEDLSTTQIYTHVSDAQMKKAVQNHPLNDLTPQKKKKQKDEES